MAERATFSVDGVGRIAVSVPVDKMAALGRVSEAQLAASVRKSATALARRISTKAPRRTSALQSGIIPSPSAERSAMPGKVVYDVYFDAAMNDTFVKTTKAGKRYYYPASQEYGFRIRRAKRKPGLYYMRDTAIDFYLEHGQIVSETVDAILEDV